MTAFRFALSLACLSLLAAIPVHAAPVDARCAKKVAFSFDDAVWSIDKEVKDAPLCDFVFKSKLDPGYSVFFWGPALKGKEAKQVAKMTPIALLQRMVDMVGLSQGGPKIAATEKSGDFETACLQTQTPSGSPVENCLGVARKAGVLLYVVHGYEAHRSDGKVPYDAAAAKAEFGKWLDGVKIGPAGKAVGKGKK